jgi:Zn-dependent metalloprotease
MILTKAFYLATMGGQHRTKNVRGVGDYKFANIAFRALATKLNQSSNFSHVAKSFVAVCQDYAAGQRLGITQDDCVQVELAFKAVGLPAK